MSTSKPNRLLAEERRREIVSVLGQHGRVTVEEIARRFGVSAVTARNESWNPSLPAGGTLSLGFNATYSGANPRPASFTLNGAPCTST